MHRETLLIVIGILTAFSLFVGLPISWLQYIVPILGLGVSFIGFTLRNRRRVLFERSVRETTAE